MTMFMNPALPVPQQSGAGANLHRYLLYFYTFFIHFIDCLVLCVSLFTAQCRGCRPGSESQRMINYSNIVEFISGIEVVRNYNSKGKL